MLQALGFVGYGWVVVVCVRLNVKRVRKRSNASSIVLLMAGLVMSVSRASFLLCLLFFIVTFNSSNDKKPHGYSLLNVSSVSIICLSVVKYQRPRYRFSSLLWMMLHLRLCKGQDQDSKKHNMFFLCFFLLFLNSFSCFAPTNASFFVCFLLLLSCLLSLLYWFIFKTFILATT